MTTTLARTPLHEWHASHGARLVDFAGWSMPVQYTSIVQEHNATRNAATLFDVSHMARLRFEGQRAQGFLDRLVTRRISDMRNGQIRYSLVTNDEGGILDDVLVYRLEDRRTGDEYFQMVVNASNRQKIVDWIGAHLANDDGLGFVDLTEQTAMIAIQGPRAAECLAPLCSTDPTALDPTALKYYTGVRTEVAGQPAIVSRTGYTGEDGWELIVDAEAGLEIWESLLKSGERAKATAAGLGCRDTLRLEAGMPLYGHELTETIDPFQAGLDFAVNLEGRSFPGHAALAKRRTMRLPQRIGLELEGRRVPREGYAILAGSERIGEVTSGTFSPTLQRPIAMGYVPPEFTVPGAQLGIDIRGRVEPARVVKLPFYRRPI